ncbi:hypothetical protein K505DRAFT_286450 [Melanomma pulvis-pyrius CBS 109.77]|uniref:DUF7730 domain-containing protein n=1 Tax=Melanomma pulvis-pyrius CBS 109.77 TaxID=1314802 RepID=A0A6A6WWZ4_9PLEO|nr:hypothetical protein K505DRAFT_286450 [Melanomma pulvis-pyrius CBS 109.77]
MMSEPHPQPSPFLRLPFEIRLIIYEYLLFPSTTPSSGQSTSVSNLLPDYHTYYTGDTDTDAFTLTVRTMDPYLGAHSSRSWRRRNTYHVRTGAFLTTTTPTTYRVLLTPYTTHLRQTIPSLLPLSRQIHAEAAKVLYSTYTFSFHTHIEALVPFLTDLTPAALAALRHLALTKKAMPYTKEFDRAEWSAACAFLATAPGVGLQTLRLDVMAGRPAAGWSGVSPITASDFEVLTRVKKEWGSEGGGVDLEWVEQLMGVKGLRKLNIRGVVEHCPPPRSEIMAFWVAFSKSIEGGFEEWVRSVMIEGK